MLEELSVRNLNVIEDSSIVLGDGMTVLTGETGAGKTLVVSAIELLMGGRADPSTVRPGAKAAEVNGRFSLADSVTLKMQDGDELILGRVIPVDGRSRAYVNGSMATVSELSELGANLVDIHGQNADQSLLTPSAQRKALDTFGKIDASRLRQARKRLREIDNDIALLGGDERTRVHELDLLQFQVDEIDAAHLDDDLEDEQLRSAEDTLANSANLRIAVGGAVSVIVEEGGVVDQIGAVLGELGRLEALEALRSDLESLQADAIEIGRNARAMGEGFDENPERLAAIGERRKLLAELKRKYGESLGEVKAFADKARNRIAELCSWEERLRELEGERKRVVDEVGECEALIGKARRSAAPKLAKAIEKELQALAMPHAKFNVEIGDDAAAEDVIWMLAANPGEPSAPLSKVASGGELSRTMLAARLACGFPEGEQRPTLIFDEVDAGVGGEAALALGKALGALARHYQVLVVTHLAQVAAFATKHLRVKKEVIDDETVTSVDVVDGEDRLIEVARMLSGQPDSTVGRKHAEELLQLALTLD